MTQYEGCNRPNGSSFPLLASDILSVINRFGANQNLFTASGWLEGTPKGGNMRHPITDANVEAILRAVRRPLLSLVDTSFVIHGFTTGVQRRLPELYRYMHALTVMLTDDGDEEKGSIEGALTGLEDANHLHHLHLGFDSTFKIDNGALVALKGVPNLRSLRLSLVGNRISATGVGALSTLKDAPHLHTLRINLGDNRIGIEGARALAALRDCRRLGPEWMPNVSRFSQPWVKRAGCVRSGWTLVATALAAWAPNISRP
jgi:hypothetical protein